MNTIYIINTSFSTNSFLSGKLGVSNYSEIVLGKKKYVETLIDKLGIEARNVVLTTDKVVTWKELYKSISDGFIYQGDLSNTNLIYYSARFFPIGENKIKFAIKKAAAISEKTFFKNELMRLEEPYIFSVPYLEVLRKRDSDEMLLVDLQRESIDVDLTQSMLDLENPTDSILLFNQNLDKRYFNSISVDNCYYFVKQSFKTDKMEAEYNFLSNVPASLRPFFPHVGVFYKDSQTASYQVEKIFSFDAAVLFKNGSFQKEEVFRDFLEKIQDCLDTAPKKKVDGVVYREQMHSLFVDKVRKRIQETKKLMEIDRLEILAKLEGFGSYDDFCDQLLFSVEKIVKKKSRNELHFSHGDLCASNIMFDTASKQLKLIDPRGWNKSIDETYRPQIYDICKLSHSFLGNYDYIMSDMFTLQLDQQGIALHFNKPEFQDFEVASIFTKFVEKNGISIRELRLLEATLFLSMIPLHQDSLSHMSAQFVQAMHLFKKGMKWL
ncbi:MAG: hypothetical protein ACOZAN_03270 [Patescibacteria group bacterium]